MTEQRGFEIIGWIQGIETIAVVRAIREHARLRKVYGGKRWRKMKGKGLVLLEDGWIGLAEIHWYEANGVGRRELKIKRLLD